MKFSRKNIERIIKKARGKDVPALEADVPTQIIALVEAVEKVVIAEAIDLLDEVAEKAFVAIEAFHPGMITREQFYAAVKALQDSIIESNG